MQISTEAPNARDYGGYRDPLEGRNAVSRATQTTEFDRQQIQLRNESKDAMRDGPISPFKGWAFKEAYPDDRLYEKFVRDQTEQKAKISQAHFLFTQKLMEERDDAMQKLANASRVSSSLNAVPPTVQQPTMRPSTVQPPTVQPPTVQPSTVYPPILSQREAESKSDRRYSPSYWTSFMNAAPHSWWNTLPADRYKYPESNSLDVDDLMYKSIPSEVRQAALKRTNRKKAKSNAKRTLSEDTPNGIQNHYPSESLINSFTYRLGRYPVDNYPNPYPDRIISEFPKNLESSKSRPKDEQYGRQPDHDRSSPDPMKRFELHKFPKQFNPDYLAKVQMRKISEENTARRRSPLPDCYKPIQRIVTGPPTSSPTDFQQSAPAPQLNNRARTEPTKKSAEPTLQTAAHSTAQPTAESTAQSIIDPSFYSFESYRLAAPHAFEPTKLQSRLKSDTATYEKPAYYTVKEPAKDPVTKPVPESFVKPAKESTSKSATTPVAEPTEATLQKWKEIEDRELRATIVLKQQKSSLVLCDESYIFDNRWYNAPKYDAQNDIENFDLVDCQSELLLVSNAVFEALPTFDCLQRLKVMQITVDQLKQMERLTKLKVLEIGILLPSASNALDLARPFQLPLIQTLCIKEFHQNLNLVDNLKFNTPALETVCFGDSIVSCVEFTNYASIRHLEFDLDPGRRAFKYTRLTGLICNEVLAIDNQTKLSNKQSEFHALQLLASLGHLKEAHLHVNGLTNMTSSDVGGEHLDDLKLFINALTITQPAEPNVQIFLEGRPYSKMVYRAFDSFHFEAPPPSNSAFKYHQVQYRKDLLSMCLKDFDRPKQVYRSFNKVSFDAFLHIVGSDDVRLEADYLLRFSDVYPNIQKVMISRQRADDALVFERSLVAFLAKLRNVSWLDCSNVQLGPDFYEFKLPSFQSLRDSLTVLHCRESTQDPTYANVNFSFLKAFKRLRFLSTNLCTTIKAYDVMRLFEYWSVRLVFDFEPHHSKLSSSLHLQRSGRFAYRIEILERTGALNTEKWTRECTNLTELKTSLHDWEEAKRLQHPFNAKVSPVSREAITFDGICRVANAMSLEDRKERFEQFMKYNLFDGFY